MRATCRSSSAGERASSPAAPGVAVAFPVCVPDPDPDTVPVSVPDVAGLVDAGGGVDDDVPEEVDDADVTGGTVSEACAGVPPTSIASVTAVPTSPAAAPTLFTSLLLSCDRPRDDLS